MALRFDQVGLALVILGGALLVLHQYRVRPISPAEKGVDVADVVRSLRAQLLSLEEEAGATPLFALKGAKIEIHFVVRQSLTDEGKIEWKAVTVGEKNEKASEEVQIIKLDLGPVETYRRELTSEVTPHD